ncbi:MULTISPECIES: amino acid ABC transporter ATP-binding protein [unclassified Arthrobacter]|uniref:amino acid ABC transporter ATP-binding protein n=1 Tax=unclassified Arthrobacter TaxID=235627 RepID=UPI00159D7D6A|nr:MULTISPECIES: amino acid ABC transporter ATP-binding protein [unclassified Arthrobacter]MCQ9164486.1 amino acid ABC transporter ATP-binding protein [Arthrobacter sp. STN4]NVM98260.1 amino acid ABC transporter ATP-binding protein [Arthrobacter sp. SDTb3-6]
MTAITETDTVVEFRGVGKRFGQMQALSNVNLSVKRGEVVVILGPSGSGKSTLCRCINRLEVIDEGHILIDGKEQPLEGRELYKFRTEVGMVFQSFNLFSHKSILENITMAPRKILGVDKKSAEARAHELLTLVGIGNKANSRPAQLSGGQKQRAAIARALAMGPKVLLFDEPTSALDPESTREVLATMRNLAENGTTMVVVTHEMSFARAFADRIVFMADGQIVEMADPESFFTAPQSERAKSFLSSVH